MISASISKFLVPLKTESYLSCPAVSHSCSTTVRPSTSMFLTWKSTPVIYSTTRHSQRSKAPSKSSIILTLFIPFNKTMCDIVRPSYSVVQRRGLYCAAYRQIRDETMNKVRRCRMHFLCYLKGWRKWLRLEGH